jgi:hypothetical protein
MNDDPYCRHCLWHIHAEQRHTVTATAAWLCAALLNFIQVTPHPRCKASVTIHTNVTTGGDEFLVTGAAVVPFTRAVPLNFVDKLEVAAARALGNELPFSWP